MMPKRHGMSKTKIYSIWSGMMQRCYNPNSKSWKYYGGRLIEVCQRWHKFENFYADMGDTPSPNHSIDRIYNDGNYYPDNVRWATREEQARNTRANKLIEFNGETKCVAEWAKLFNIKTNVLWHRINQNWKLEEAFTKPLGTSYPNICINPHPKVVANKALYFQSLNLHELRSLAHFWGISEIKNLSRDALIKQLQSI